MSQASGMAFSYILFLFSKMCIIPFDFLYDMTSKILYLENGDILGGAELFSLDFFKSIREKKSQTQEYIIGLGNVRSGVWKKWTEELEVNSSFRMLSVFLPQLKPFSIQSIGRWIRASWELKKTIAEEQITHVHANTVRTFLIAGLCLIFLPKHIQFSFFAHDFTAPSLFLRLFSKRCFQVLACSEDVSQYLREAGVPAEKTIIIPNGVDPQKFAHIPPFITEEISQRPLKIGILGRIDEWKGQHIFVKSAKIFLETFPDAQFFVFGEPTEHDPKTLEFYEGLKIYVKMNHLENNIFFCGFVPPEKAFEKIDIVVHASTEKEPFGRVPIEGAMAGKCLIISAIGMPMHIFTDRENALFFEPKNAFDLAQKIKIVWENRLYLQTMAESAKKLAEEKFLLSSVTHQLEEFFTKTETIEHTH